MIDDAVAQGSRLNPAARILGLTARTIQRWRLQKDDGRHGPLTVPANKLSPEERQLVLSVANSPVYREMSPKQIVPRLADQGQYIASESTFYRILRATNQLTHRQRSRPATHRRPKEKTATGPCQVWSWDITYLRSSIRGQFFYLYLILDVWSRKIIAATVFPKESGQNSALLFVEAFHRHGVDPKSLTLHSDNGSPMKGSTMLATLQRLGVVPSFSRPGVSNDNPFSESLFRTLKYRPEYPSRPFATEQDAQKWVDAFVHWYNTEHLHSEIRFVTPDDRHYGQDTAKLKNRKNVYEQAREKNPERWARHTRNWTPIEIVRLNPERKRPSEEGLKSEAA
ncbi:Transposase InsO and inactivated derivatives [Malonomonas rubra DSM 5091]|uniref:Transposase InsO and inactivated derivatives n=1 Tax=Malonomonas rubra DSM 5091 TaxID=1122189 RepID=A0A1M6KTR1_MALRU|nr:Transposase InsO and inactivated derivatives [Malonomonas rubra DSM 5091]